MRASTELDNVIDAGFDFRNEPDGRDGHVHKDVIGGFDYFDAIFKIGDRYFQGTINIKNIAKGKLFKDLTKIKDVTEDIGSSYGETPKSTFLRTSSTNSISKTSQKGNEKFSLGYHAGNLGTAESLTSQSGDHSTGNFGIGTYFVGNKVVSF